VGVCVALCILLLDKADLVDFPCHPEFMTA
jgi:hypothetical protein